MAYTCVWISCTWKKKEKTSKQVRPGRYYFSKSIDYLAIVVAPHRALMRRHAGKGHPTHRILMRRLARSNRIRMRETPRWHTMPRRNRRRSVFFFFFFRRAPSAFGIGIWLRRPGWHRLVTDMKMRGRGEFHGSEVGGWPPPHPIRAFAVLCGSPTLVKPWIGRGPACMRTSPSASAERPPFRPVLLGVADLAASSSRTGSARYLGAALSKPWTRLATPTTPSNWHVPELHLDGLRPPRPGLARARRP